MSMEQELQDIITKHLPKATGDALQARLKKADDDERENASLKDKLAELNVALELTKAQRAELTGKLASHKSLDEREAAVGDRERNAAIALLQFELAATHDKANFCREVALGLVRNVEYRDSVHKTGSTSASGYAPSGSTSQNGGITESVTTSREAK